jgi:4-amino-4-deoxy-L-arabinose transferase-like glycosyltransferase
MPGCRKKTSICLGIVIAGFSAAILSSFLLFPSVSRTYDAVLDPDSYGRLGRNVYAGNGLTYHPEDGPTIFRGPLYPAFIALSLHLTGGRYPGGVWLSQSLLHGLTCWLIFLLALELWNRTVALTAALIYAFYPPVLWQIPRMWNEILLAFLVTALVYLGSVYLKKPSPIKAAGLGAVLALLSLTKAIFLPFLVLFPLVLLFSGQTRIVKDTVLIAMTAILLIAPWSVRNWRLSGRFIPVHVGMGGNMKRGNLMAPEFFRYPLSYRVLFQKTDPVMKQIKSSVQGTQWERNLRIHQLMKASAFEDIRRDPTLIVKKAVSAGAMFWLIGDTSIKTLALLILRLPIIFLFARAAVRGLRAGRAQLRPAVSIVVLFWLMHLPFAPNARLSVPLLPILVLLASVEIARLPFLRRPPSC